MLTIETKRIDPDIVVLQLAGRLTLGRDAQHVEWQVADLVKSAEKKVILDLSQLDHIDSTGIGIVVACSGKLRQSGGELRLAGAKGLVAEVLKLTNVSAIVSMFDNADAAAQNFSRPA